MILTHLSEIVHKGMGWCPNAQMFKTTPAVLSTLPAIVHPLEPDGGAGDAGRIGRGAGIVADSIKTLVRNRQLLWFSVLTGLVIVFMVAAQYLLRVLGSYPYEMIGFPLWVILSFAIELVSIMGISYVLAALVLYRSSEYSGHPITIREGLSGTKEQIRPLFCWSLILASGVTAVFIILLQYFGDVMLSVLSLITRFPFYFILEPEVNGPGPIAGGFHLMFASTFTVVLMILNVLVLLLTLYVVPVLVLEKKSIPGAIAESARLIKKSWGEMVVCFLIFGVLLLLVSLTSLIFQLAYNAITFESQSFWFQVFWYKGGWIITGGLYILIWCALAVIGSTAAGIAMWELYTYSTTGQRPVTQEEKRGAQPLPA